MYRQESEHRKRELEAITAWRTGKDQSAPEQGLVGLALSGGGIRSATFGLGVLERLRAIGLLERVDYLSTVSGGGYIGAWLSANCLRQQRLARKRQPAPPGVAPGTAPAADATPAAAATGTGTNTGTQDADPVSWLSGAANWDASISHLRRYSKYLSPQVGLLSADTWTMGTVWLRNALLTQTIIVMLIAWLLLLARVMHELFDYWPRSGGLRWLAVVLFSVAAGGIAKNQHLLDAKGNRHPVARARIQHGLAGLLLMAAVIWLSHLVPNGMFTDGLNSYLVVPISLVALWAGYLGTPWLVHLAFLLLSRIRRKHITVAAGDYGQGAVQVFVIVPMVAVGFLLGAVLWGQAGGGRGGNVLSSIRSYGQLWQTSIGYWELSLVLAFGSLFMFAWRSTEWRAGWHKWKQAGVVVVATAFSGLVLHSLMVLIMLGLNDISHSDGGSWRAMVWAPPAILFSFSLAVVMLIGMQGVDTIEAVREWWSRMGAWLCIYGMAWMIVMTASVYGPLVAAYLFSVDNWTVDMAVVASVTTTVIGIFAGKSGATSDQERAHRSPFKMVLNALALVAPFLLIAGLLIAVAFVINLVTNYLIVKDFVWIGFHALEAFHWVNLQADGHASASALLLLAVTVVLVVMVRRVDINEFSLNAFYRNRLARCYLGATRVHDTRRKPQRFIGFDPKDDLELAELVGTPPLAVDGKVDADAAPVLAGPFHIFNCALNLGGSSDLSVHTRHSACYTLTPHCVGSSYRSGPSQDPDTGYAATRDFGGELQPLTVAKAMAVSGAAASPNMGFHTSPLVAFALTFFNVRLGWWFPSGRVVAGRKSRARSKTSPTFGLRYLIQEMLGLAGTKSKFLMISDGGHFENLAAYELIGRRCRVVIVSDAECDPDLKFEGLGNLIRMCKVDHRTDIDIDVRPIKEGRQTSAVGKIFYPAGDGPAQAMLIYLKASMLGDEGAAVAQYRAMHPTFPHESTGNQFYGEDQFESYRTLGAWTAERALGDVTFDTGLASTAATLIAALWPAGKERGGTGSGARFSAPAAAHPPPVPAQDAAA